MFTETWYPTRDGVVTSLTAFRRGLEAQGHEVFIFAAGSKETRAANTDSHVRIYPGPEWGPYPDYRLAVSPGPTRALLRSLKVDVVHAHGTALMGIKAVRCARTSRLPFLLTFHTRVEDATGYVTTHPAREAMLRRLIWKWHRWYFNQCDAVVTPTEAVKRDLEREAPGRMRRVFVIPTGVDIKRFARARADGAREKYGLGGGQVVLTVGRVAWEKNLDTLLNAAERVASKDETVRFAVAGRGPALEHFRAEVARRRLEGTVRFLGFVPDDDLPSLYHAADAFLMPSTFETQGLALLEAMAAGVPVAAADTGGPTHFLRSGQNGFLFEGTNAEACARAVESALSASGDVRARGQGTATMYSIERQAEALASAYEDVLKARGARAKAAA